MRIANATGSALVAFGWHHECGYGPEVTIPPGEAKNLFGPYMGERYGEPCWAVIPGGVVCHEDADGNDRYRVAQGHQLTMKMGDVGCNIRHYADARGVSDDEYKAHLSAGPVEKMPDFPFGIDPSQPLCISGRVYLEVEGYGACSFTDPYESVISLANQVMVLHTGKLAIVNYTRDYLTIVAWDEKSGHLKVKISK